MYVSNKVSFFPNNTFSPITNSALNKTFIDVVDIEASWNLGLEVEFVVTTTFKPSSMASWS
jgi:hypothetical protein